MTGELSSASAEGEPAWAPPPAPVMRTPTSPPSCTAQWRRRGPRGAVAGGEPTEAGEVRREGSISTCARDSDSKIYTQKLGSNMDTNSGRIRDVGNPEVIARLLLVFIITMIYVRCNHVANPGKLSFLISQIWTQANFQTEIVIFRNFEISMISMISSDIFDHRQCITIAKAYSVIFLNSISRKTKPIIRQKPANPLV